ncbi:twin-arginine translocation signal domain-containing protein [Sporomusa sp. KB1]|jgi:hypothetical protein|uniref:twin-arginine translocation signal domain-containing protein n=1 Tax=Sporomusa sp. KB1 TaxID=943346 RepID=UPI0011A3687A|nr:twin-arginine translocation signal domain-containing protein [Sporomusa sp. KB1]TWH48087.1 secreted protein [Sporomusa sp. KB1]
MLTHDEKEFSRRDFLKVSAGAAAALAMMTVMPTSTTAAKAMKKASTISLADCQRLSPADMAQKSVLVQDAYQFILQSAKTIKDTKLRTVVIDILTNPAPNVAQRYISLSEREALRVKLIANGLLKNTVTTDEVLPPIPANGRKPQNFDSTPGSGYMSHHSYPGGLPVHTALNVRSSLGLYQGYLDSNTIQLDRDVILAGQLLHDLHKPWVFQWKEDGSSLPEYQMAGTGAHHILGIAESIYRDLPAKVIVAQASAHDNAGTPDDEAKLVNYIKAAAIIAGKDPIAQGLLADNGDTLKLPRPIEPFVVYLGDHDWIVSVPAAKWTIPLIENIAKTDYGISGSDSKGSLFYSFRNYIFSQATIMGIHQIHASQGEQAVREVVHSMILVPK